MNVLCDDSSTIHKHIHACMHEKRDVDRQRQQQRKIFQPACNIRHPHRINKSGNTSNDNQIT